MKTKKALAVILAVVMLVMPLAVSSLAATATEIITNPLKTAYNDSEHFSPQGLSILVDNELVIYTPGDANFRFDPALNELLTVETTGVAVYYDNTLVGIIPVTVEHILDAKLTAIDAGHGNYCLGCGELHNFTEHVVNEWIPNDDGGIFLPQTQTGYCVDCGAEVTQNIVGSQGIVNIFDSENATDTELLLTELFKLLVASLVQMLVGIS